MTLVEFLRARLDQDELFAREALQRTWFCQDNVIDSAEGGSVARFEIKADARHAAGWHPARVLAEVAAKRQIVDECEDAQRNAAVPTPEQLATQEHWAVIARTYEYVLRLLALPHAEHPEYRDEWAP